MTSSAACHLRPASAARELLREAGRRQPLEVPLGSYAKAISRGPGPLGPPKGFRGHLQLALIPLLTGLLLEPKVKGVCGVHVQALAAPGPRVVRQCRLELRTACGPCSGGALVRRRAHRDLNLNVKPFKVGPPPVVDFGVRAVPEPLGQLRLAPGRAPSTSRLCGGLSRLPECLCVLRCDPPPVL
eukprot:scaffold1727_cov61-Phaeocystis_antarctica.AAC.4